MGLIEAQQRLEEIRGNVEAAVKRRDSAAYQQFYWKLVAAERAVQMLKGSEFAEPLENAGWQPSFPSPLIVADGFEVWLICPIASSSRPLLCRAARFEAADAHRVVGIGDELAGVPLSGKGLETCKALEVINSKWLKHLRSRDTGQVEELRHFAFCFKDSLVEIAAKRVIWLTEERPAQAWLADIESRSVFFGAVAGSPPPDSPPSTPRG